MKRKLSITRTHQLCSLFRVNQAALHAVLKPENMSIVNFRLCARFKYVSNSYYPVSNRSLDHCFHSFRSLFESISIDYKALELNYLQLSAAFFGIGELPSRALWFTLPDPIIITMNLRQYSTQSINATLSSPFSFRPENWIKVQKRQA